MQRIFALASLVFAWGCSIGSVQMEALAISARKPSQVALVLRVDPGTATSARLNAENFEIYEDDQRVLPEVSRQTLLERDAATSFRTVLLVDLSTATSESVRAEIARAIGIFAERVLPTQALSVYAFDGLPELRPVVERARGTKLGKAELQRIVKMAPRDPSRNLYGAVRLGVERLTASLSTTFGRVPIGTLVVFSGGPDLAGRVSEADALSAIDARPYAIITIAVSSPEGRGRALREREQDRFVEAQDLETFSLAFEEAAHEVEREYQRHYLLSYCSPARAGTRTLRLELRVGEKDDERRGSLVEEFSAEGFTAGCDPEAIPTFQNQPTKPR